MLTLRTFHLGFILLAIVGADLFGAWAIWSYRHTHDPGTLILGVAVLLGGFGLIGYAIHLVRVLDRSKVT